MKKIALISLFIAGFVFRLLLVKLFPQPFAYDQYEYSGFAYGILREGFHADTLRLYGYPLLMSPIIAIFGHSNPWPYSIVHALLDCGTAIMVYAIARIIFKKKHERVSWLGYIFYLFNPFTSSYVGVFMTEIVAIFLVTASIYLFLLYLLGRKKMILFLLFFVLGYIPQVRPSFLYFSFFLVGVTLIMFLPGIIQLSHSASYKLP